MSWSLKAHAVANAAGSSTATTGAINTTGADLLVVTVGYYQGASGTSLTDSKSNTWTGKTVRSISGDTATRIYYAWNPTVGSGHTFSFSGSVIYVTLCVAAFSGSQTSSDPFDTENGATHSAASTLQPGSCGSNGELVVTSFAKGGGSGTDTIDSSFSITDQAAYSSGNWYGGDLAWLAATGAVNPTWTIGSGSGGLASAIASFKASSGTTYTQTLNATANAVASIVRQTGKILNATAGGPATLTRQTAKILPATGNATATLTRQTGKVVTATGNATASIVRQTGKVLAALGNAVATLLGNGNPLTDGIAAVYNALMKSMHRMMGR